MKRFFRRFFSTTASLPPRTVVVVSGLPRSGTSMMMKMVEAGGLSVLTDKLRTPDEDNPKGYYEFERVKRLDDGDTAWLSQAEGKAVKVISALLRYLPADYHYKVLFMRRDLREVLMSQRKMLIRRGEDPDKTGEAELIRLFTKHLQQVETWLYAQSNMEVLDIPYNQVLLDPRPFVQRVNAFLGGWLDEEAMAKVIDPKLYRMRGPASAQSEPR